MRNAGYLLSERRTYFGSEIRMDYDDLVNRGKPIYLYSGYLASHGKGKESGDQALAFRVELKMDVPLFEVEKRFWFDTHFEGGELYADSVQFFLRERDGRPSVRYKLASEPLSDEKGTLLEVKDETENERIYEVPVETREGVAPGMRGRLVLRASNHS